MYTYVTYIATDDKGRTIQALANAGCFGALVNGSNDWKKTVTLKYSPPILPYLNLFQNLKKPTEILGNYTGKLSSWVKALNLMVGQNLFSLEDGFIIYKPPKDCFNSEFKFHTFLMRQAFNNPIVLLFTDFLGGTTDGERIWKAVAFLSTISSQVQDAWGGNGNPMYDNTHNFFSTGLWDKKHLCSMKEVLKNLKVNIYVQYCVGENKIESTEHSLGSLTTQRFNTAIKERDVGPYNSFQTLLTEEFAQFCLICNEETAAVRP